MLSIHSNNRGVSVEVYMFLIISKADRIDIEKTKLSNKRVTGVHLFWAAYQLKILRFAKLHKSLCAGSKDTTIFVLEKSTRPSETHKYTAVRPIINHLRDKLR